MIQYYLDLQNQALALNEKKLSGGQIQKIYSTAFYISMAIRTPGKTLHLYFGRGGGFEGIWLHDTPPTSELRKKDTFLEYLRRHVSSCGFIGLELDKYDRIVKLDYQKYGQVQSILFFWRARKLYFVHYYQEDPHVPFKLLLSWRGKAIVPQEIDDLFALFDEVGRRTDLKHDMHAFQPLEMEELLQEEVKVAELKGMTSNPTFLQRKKDNIETDLRRAQQWERLQSMLDHGASLEGYEIKVGDHKIKFEGDLNPHERRNILFQKIKKLKRGEGILSERLKNVQELLAGKEIVMKAESKLAVIRPVWGKEEIHHLEESPREAGNDFKLIKTEHFQVGIGLSAQGNDQLRSKWANKEDFWFHLDGHKSAHVIMKLLGNKALDAENLNIAATILACFSHFNDDWIPIVYTAVKNLKGVTGAPGMVIYKKEKHLSCPRVDVSHWLKE